METNSELLDSQNIILALDASSSARELWVQVAQAAATVCDVASETYVLGCDRSLGIEEFGDSLPAFPHDRARRCGLIAPIMEAILRQSRTVDALIIIGNGEVWDLGDWVDCPLVREWLLVRVGDDSLQASDLRLLEVPPERLEAAVMRLAGSSMATLRAPATDTSFWSSVKYSWHVDRTGFPLIHVEPVRAYVHLFPVARAQFERLLWQENDPAWDDDHYAELLEGNPRASPADMGAGMYEGLFLTGILPDEVSQFARWLGRGFGLLEPHEWQATWAWLARQEATAAPAELTSMGLSSFAADMWQALLMELKPSSMLELSLLEGGVVEWVYDSVAAPSQRHVGMGRPRSSFFATVKSADKPLVPINPNRRMPQFGFRLKRRS